MAPGGFKAPPSTLTGDFMSIITTQSRGSKNITRMVCLKSNIITRILQYYSCIFTKYSRRMSSNEIASYNNNTSLLFDLDSEIHVGEFKSC